MSATALICVDVQRDFIDGALGAPHRARVIDPLVRIACSPSVDVVIASRDWHPIHHCSFSADPKYRDDSWPVHCVQGTAGAELDPKIVAIANAVVDKGTDPTKEAYSAFDGGVMVGNLRLSLHNLLQAREITSVIIGGLCTEYCVRETALDAVDLGYRTTVVLDAIEPVSYSNNRAAIEQMELAGVRIVPTLEAPAPEPYTPNDLELLPQKRRVTMSEIDEYPNTLTLRSIDAAVRERAAKWNSPLKAFLTVADGVRNWTIREHE